MCLHHTLKAVLIKSIGLRFSLCLLHYCRGKNELARLDDSFLVLYNPTFMKFSPLQTYLFVCTYSHGWFPWHSALYIHIMQFPSQNLPRNWNVWPSIDVFQLLPPWCESIYQHLTWQHSRSLSLKIISRLQFACWFDVDCVSFHCLKTRYTVLCDISANSTTSSTLCPFEHPKAITTFCQSVTFVFRSILQHAKTTIIKQLDNHK